MKSFYLVFVLTILLVSVFSKKRISKRRFKTYLRRFQQWPTVGKSTPSNDWGNGQTIYLDRHVVNCGIGALSQFRFQRTIPTQFKYDYMCLFPKNCVEHCIKNIEKIDRERMQKVIHTIKYFRK